MKAAILLSLLSVSAFAATNSLKTVARTKNDCKQVVEIKGKEGDKSVIAIRDGKEVTLTSKDGSAYSSKSMNDVEFVSADKSLTYIHPSTVNGNPPKIMTSDKMRCSLELK